MLKSHKQCLALLCLAFFTPSRPFALSLLSLYLLPAFCFVQRSGEKRVKMRAIWKGNDRAGQTGKKRGMRERDMEKWWTRQKARMCGGEQRTKEPCRRHSSFYLQPGYSPSHFSPLNPTSGSMEQNRHKKHSRLALWQAKEKQKLTWTCPTDNWLKFGQGGGTSPARVALRRSRREGIVSVKR